MFAVYCAFIILLLSCCLLGLSVNKFSPCFPISSLSPLGHLSYFFWWLSLNLIWADLWSVRICVLLEETTTLVLFPAFLLSTLCPLMGWPGILVSNCPLHVFFFYIIHKQLFNLVNCYDFYAHHSLVTRLSFFLNSLFLLEYILNNKFFSEKIYGLYFSL